MPPVQFDPDRVQLATRIPSGLHRAIKLAALAADVTVREWVADALATHLRACRGSASDESGPGRPKATLVRRARGAA